MGVLNQIAAGSFTSAGVPLVIPFAGDPQIVRLYYQGNASGNNWTSNASPGVIKELYWNEDMGPSTGLGTYNTAGALTDTKAFISANGVSVYDPSSSLQLGPVVTATGISQAATAVVTGASASYPTGAIVRVTQVTGGDQIQDIAGMIFQVTNVSSSSFDLNGLNSSGFGAAATAASFQQILYPNVWQPLDLMVTNVTQAASAVVTTSINHNYQVGEIILFTGFGEFGMTQINGQQATITAVTANTMTVNLNTTAYNAFAWPATQPPPFQFPQVSNVGTSGSLVLNAYDNIGGFKGVYLGTSVCGPSGALVLYEIIQSDAFS